MLAKPLLTKKQRKKYCDKLLLNLPPSPYKAIGKKTGDTEIFVRKFFKGQFDFDQTHRVIKAVSSLIIKTNAKRSKQLQDLAALAFDIQEKSFHTKQSK